MTPPDALVNEPEVLTDGLLRRLTTEVRQTLHNVLGSIEVVSEEALSDQQGEHLIRCRENLHELLRIANDVSELVDFSSLGERGCPFGFTELLEQFSDLVHGRAERKHLDLRWSVAPDVPNPVIGYRHVIESALYRLVDNSLEFTEQGGITITVKVKDSNRQFRTLAIEVSDTRPGIAQGVLNDLQRPISEARNPGLGLRLAQKHLAAIGGQIEVIDSGSEGATVAIIFPVTLPTGDAIDESGLEERSNGAALRLLVAEDSDDSFAVFETFVKDEGHRVTRAINGAEAVEMFNHGRFDMVVMDVNMPVMDGYTATRMIREWETKLGRARLPILLLSADDAGRQSRIGSAVGCSGYLTKPTPKQDLLRALRHYTSAARP